MTFQQKGIDVSSWQGDIAWDKVKGDGVQFAMIRVAASTNIDKKFVRNIEGALAQGISCGVYVYSLAQTPEQAVQEAELVLKTIRPYRIHYPVAYDIEDKAQRTLTVEQRTALVQAFCGRIKKEGYLPAVYSSSSWFDTMLQVSELSGYHFWVAQWGVSKAKFAGTLHMWQYTDKGKVAGIGGDVDLDIAYWNYGQAAPAPAAAQKPVVPAPAQAQKPNPSGGAKTPLKSGRLLAGDTVALTDTPLYPSATDSHYTGRVSGQYWIYDGVTINGRLRLTNALSRVRKKPEAANVTGYASASELKALTAGGKI